MELKKLGVLSVAKVALIFGVIYGLISGIVLSIAIAAAKADPTTLAQISPIIQKIGYLSIVILPIVNGVIYFIVGIILAWVYNLIASWFGGIKVELIDNRAKKK